VFQIGIIGTGGMGNHHAREIMQRDDARVTAMCDISEASMDRLEVTLGMDSADVQRYNSVDALLAGRELDAVIIATPHTEHADQVRACLHGGLHVLCEKPMATTASDARAFIDAAEESGKILAVAYQRHGDGKFIRTRELIREGAIGDIRLVHVVIAQDCLHVFQPGATWRADPKLSGGGHFMDTGSHVNDILLWTTGLEPQRVNAFINQEGTLVDVVTSVSVEFTNGAVGSLSYTSLSPEWREEFTYYGTEGVIRFGAAEPLMLHRSGEDIVLPRTPASGKAPAQNFIDAIKGEAKVQAPPICGLRVAQLTEAAYASAKSGKPETVG
jgi:predicted dehydrogenase